MTDIMSLLNSLQRPNLLVRAARHGVSEYNRDRDLRRLLKTAALPSPRQAIMRLIEEEIALNAARVSGDGRYTVVRHVAVLIALLGEARLVPTTQVDEPLGQVIEMRARAS